MNTRKLDRKKFNAIRERLLSTDDHMTVIAKDFGLGPSSVSLVNNEATWENHLVGKRGTKTLRQRRKRALQLEARRTPVQTELRPVVHKKSVTSAPAKQPVATSLPETPRPNFVTIAEYVNDLRARKAMKKELSKIRLDLGLIWALIVVLFILVGLSLVQ